jgi:geranylgeranyl reductase family protein
MGEARRRHVVDLLVVGLGPGGGSAAAVAAGAGLRVIGIDKKRELGQPVQCAEFIPNPMGGYAREGGVMVQRIVGMQTELPSSRRIGSGFPGLMIDRARFDQAIAGRARRAGASLWSGARLSALNTERREAEVRRADGTVVRIAFQVLIAADGPHSPVADSLGLTPLATVNTRQYTVPLLVPYADTDIFLSDAYPGGYGWLFPKGEVANLGLGADKRHADNLKIPLDRLHASLMLRGVVGRRILGRTGGSIPVGGMRSRLHHDSVVFVGDAAGLTHPITGAGIHAAVVSGEAAGQAANALLGGDTDALDDYEEDLRDQFQATLDRAVARRGELRAVWGTPAAHRDAVMRRGWIAFDEYFA